MAGIPVDRCMQAVPARPGDSHTDNVTDFAGLYINNHRLQPGRPANLLAAFATGLLDHLPVRRSLFASPAYAVAQDLTHVA